MAAKSIKLVETQEEVEHKMLESVLREVQSALDNKGFQFEMLQEKLSNLDRMMDNSGWSAVGEYDSDGPSLVQLKAASSQIRNLMALNSWIKRGKNLRYNYIFEGGIHYKNIPTGTSDKRRRDLEPNVQELVDHPQNQRYFFGDTAQSEREGSLYSDGQALYLGDDETKLLRPLPITQITADYRNPDDNSEIWAYRKTWQHFPQGSTTPEERHEWFFHNAFWDKKTPKISVNNKQENVNQTTRVFGEPVNSQTGWAYGIPDALAAIAWVKMYRDFIVNGFTVTSAMAQIWATAKQNAQAGGDNVTTVLGGGGVGRTAVMSNSDSLTPLSTAGQAYAFDKGNPIIAAAATAIEVSAIAITADTSVAGSSYGSAQTLDPPTRMAMASRRKYHVALEKAILKWMGAKDPQVWFIPYDDSTELFRAVQAIRMKWDSGVYSAEEIKEMYEALEGRYGPVTVPEGVLTPNNAASLARKDIDTDGTDTSSGTPGQGQNSVAGKGTNANDVRDDGIG